MKKLILLTLCFFCISTTSFSEDYYKYRQNAVTSGSYNKASISMAIWGVGLAVGIGLVCAFIKRSSSGSSSL